MFAKTIVAFDGSERSLEALLLAEALADPGGELIVCCVHRYDALAARIDPTEPSVDRDAAERSVRDATSRLTRGLAVTPVLLPGANASAVLQRIAVERDAELIVLGSSHRGALGRVLIGSVSEETLHGAPCPVAVAPVGAEGTPPRLRLARIAFGCDVVEPLPGALAAAVALCVQTGAALRVIAVAEDAAVQDPERSTLPYAAIAAARLSAAEDVAGELLAGLPETISASIEVRDGAPAQQLLEISNDVDLLVLGAHSRGVLGRLIMGSVCDAVVRAAACPVLVIPPRTGADQDVSGADQPALDRVADQLRSG